MRGPFGGDVAQATMEASSVHPGPPLPPPADSLVGESFSREEFHEPEVGSEIPGLEQPDERVIHIGTPKGQTLFAPSTG